MTIANLYYIYKTTGCGKEVLNDVTTKEEKRIIKTMEEDAKNGDIFAYYDAFPLLQRKVNSKDNIMLRNPYLSHINIVLI